MTVVASGRPTRPRRPRGGPEDRNVCLGARRHPRARPRQASRSEDRRDRACQSRSRQDRAARRGCGCHRIRLAVGHARAQPWRQAGFLSLLERARGRHGAVHRTDPNPRRSEGQEARGCRRGTRQELAPRSGRDETGRHRPQDASDDRLRRAGASRRERRAARSRRHAELLELLRGAGSQRLPPPRRRRRVAAPTRRQGASCHARLCVRRILGGKEP